MCVCERCSEMTICKGIKHDPGECECIENMYDEELDGNDEFYEMPQTEGKVA